MNRFASSSVECTPRYWSRKHNTKVEPARSPSSTTTMSLSTSSILHPNEWTSSNHSIRSADNVMKHIKSKKSVDAMLDCHTMMISLAPYNYDSRTGPRAIDDAPTSFRSFPNEDSSNFKQVRFSDERSPIYYFPKISNKSEIWYSKKELYSTKQEALKVANSCEATSSQRRGVENLSRAGSLQLASRRRYIVIVVLDEQAAQRKAKGYVTVEELAKCAQDATKLAMKCAVARAKQDAGFASAA